MSDILEPEQNGDEMPVEVIPIDSVPSLVTPSNENHLDEMVPDLNKAAETGAFAIPVEGPALVMPVTIEAKTENRKQVSLFIQEDDLCELWDRASKARVDVISTITDASTASDLLNHIEIARNELLAGKENYEQAERHINLVEYQVAHKQRIDRLSGSVGIWLFVYETVWAIVLLAFLFLVLGPAAFSSAAIPLSSWASPDVVFLLGSMTWGGLGGVIGAWLSLVKHISREQDFDRQHLLWYINSPVMGIGVGAVIFLVLRAGLLSITGPTEGISSPLVIYLLAWLSGFQQNVFTDLIRRLLQVFKIEGEGEAGEPAPMMQRTTDVGKIDHGTNGRT